MLPWQQAAADIQNNLVFDAKVIMHLLLLKKVVKVERQNKTKQKSVSRYRV